MNKKIMVYLILSVILMSSLVVVGDPNLSLNETLITKGNYKEYGLDYYYENEIICGPFHLPLIFPKNKIDILSSKDIEYQITNIQGASDRISDVNYKISDLGDSFLVDFYGTITASDEPFSVDIVPVIKGNSLSNYAFVNSSWNNYKLITIQHEQVHGTLTNFPVLLNFTDPNLIGNVLENGNDIVFVNIDNTSKYNHELEDFNGTTGRVLAYVNVTTLYDSNDTRFIMYYNNPSASAQENVDNTWDDSYTGVYHYGLQDGNYLVDSTHSARNASDTGDPIQNQSAYLYNSAHRLDGATDWYTGPSSNQFVNPSGTISFYGSTDDSGVVAERIVTFHKTGGSGSRYSLMVYDDSGTDRVSVYAHDGASGQYIHSNSTFTVDELFHGATTCNNGKIGVFYNGVLDSSIVAQGIGGVGTNAVTIGTYAAGSTDYCWDGWMDELRISNIARSRGYIHTEYNNFVNATNGGFFIVSGVGTVDRWNVTFQDYDTTTLKIQFVANNTDATPPASPTRAGFTFAGWSGNYTSVVQNETVIATYTSLNCTLILSVSNSNGNITDPGIGTYNVTSGTTVYLNASSLDADNYSFLYWYGDTSIIADDEDNTTTLVGVVGVTYEIVAVFVSTENFYMSKYLEIGDEMEISISSVIILMLVWFVFMWLILKSKDVIVCAVFSMLNFLLTLYMLNNGYFPVYPIMLFLVGLVVTFLGIYRVVSMVIVSRRNKPKKRRMTRW